ncbi:MAG: biopolymer transporter ExbD [Phycisphaerales bacterium]|nr:biopolymer transporter ExbD [Phycisphaerales bacterium]
MSVIFQRGPARPQASLTPMIDVVFLLVVFFVAVSQIVDQERLDMDLPAPNPSAAHQPAEGPRAVVNVIPGPGGSSLGYRVDGLVFPADAVGQQSLADHLRDRMDRSPGLYVNVRADRQTGWGWVAPVLGAARHAAATASPPLPAARVRVSVEPAGMSR